MKENLEEKTQDKKFCANPGCGVVVKENSKYQINNEKYCPDCYIYLTRVKHY